MGFCLNNQFRTVLLAEKDNGVSFIYHPNLFLLLVLKFSI